MSNPYPCRGAIFSSQRAAAEAMETEVSARWDSARLIQAPYAYLCLDGHWHYDVRWRD